MDNLQVPSPWSEIKQSAAAKLVLVVGAVCWALSVGLKPNLASFIAALTPLALFVVIMTGAYRRDETPDGYFLANRRMPPSDFPGTFVVTNVGLFSSIFYSMFLSYHFGLPGMVYPVVGWFLGMYLFAKAIPRLLPFLRRGDTLHQYLAEAYGRTPGQQRLLRIIGGIITGSLYWASLGVEVKFGANLLSRHWRLFRTLCGYSRRDWGGHMLSA
jgi:Na+/proline symporter